MLKKKFEDTNNFSTHTMKLLQNSNSFLKAYTDIDDQLTIVKKPKVRFCRNVTENRPYRILNGRKKITFGFGSNKNKNKDKGICHLQFLVANDVLGPFEAHTVPIDVPTVLGSDML